MARETSLLSSVLVGTVGVAATFAVGSYALGRYRDRFGRRADPRVVCTECGESLAVSDVLDPTVTCGCAAASDAGSSWRE